MRRTLVIRLALACLVISAGVGIFVFLYQRKIVSEAAAGRAERVLERFSRQYDFLLQDPLRLDREAIGKAFQEWLQKQFAETQEARINGEFVAAGLYTVDGRPIAEVREGNHPLAQAASKLLNASRHAIQPGETNKFEVVRRGRHFHLRVILPLKNSSGLTVGIAEGIYAFSDKTIKDLRKRQMRAVILTILVVVLTTAILYPVILRLTRQVSNFAVRLLEANLETLEVLGSAIALRDSDTNAHNYRVSLYCARIGQEIGLPPQTMRALIKGAFLHDVGKIGIPDEVLHKPAKLDTQEFEVMKTHVDRGRELVARSKWLRDALAVVYSHHEKVAGGGYPKGLSKWDIPITARIFAIADVFDALTSRRPYKEPLPYDRAMEIVEEGRGTHFDPALLDTFRRVAKSLYDRYGGQEVVPHEELQKIIQKYFAEEMESLGY